MASGGPEEHDTNQEASKDTLATPNTAELPPTLQSQPRPSGLSEDGAHDSEDEERQSNVEEDEIERQIGNGEEDKSGVEEENQKDGNEADDTNQTDENEPENGNQEDDNEADQRNDGRQSDSESLRERDGQSVQSYIANKAAGPLKVIGFGDRISHNSIFSVPFSSSFLESFGLDEVKHRIEAIEAYSNAVSELHRLVRPHIIDVEVLGYFDIIDRRDVLMRKSLASLDGHASNEMKLSKYSTYAKYRLYTISNTASPQQRGTELYDMAEYCPSMTLLKDLTADFV